MPLSALKIFAGFLFSGAIATAHATDAPSTDDIPEKCGLYAYKAEVTEVYDGDSITADVDLGFSVWRKGEKLRLFGIDAPEMRGDQRPAGIVARDALRARILNREVIICTIKDKTGKYGRYLAEVFVEDENINAWMMDEGFAVPYDGGARRADMFSLGGLFAERFQRAPLGN